MHSEIHTDSVMLLVSELPRLEAVDDTRLPHVAVSNEDYFEQEITGVLFLRSCGLRGHDEHRDHNTTRASTFA